jgi:hypothetical protein
MLKFLKEKIKINSDSLSNIRGMKETKKCLETGYWRKYLDIRKRK